MMMKKYGLITKVLLISMFAILLNGCENSLTSEFSSKANEAKFYTITGNIDVDAISAENSSRTGLPTIPSIDDNSINFSVSATKDGKIITGTVTGNQYSITLLKGSWTITVIGEKAGVKVLEGSINVNTEDEPTTQQTITLKTINAGTGSLSLTISISKEENLSCGGVKATLYNNSSEIKNEEHLTFDTTNSTTWDVKDLNAGTYEIKLDFYQTMTFNADGTSYENLLYSHHDTVNIFANLVTNTWTGSGYTENSFKLTQTMITNFAMTTFYVSNSGKDSNAGTYFAPFATMQKAVETINGINDGTSPYTIYVMNDITGTDSDFTDDNKALINVVPGENKSLNLKICGFGNEKSKINAGRNVSQTGRVMYIGKNANVTLQNLKLTGGYLSDTKGGGIYSEGTCSLSSCTISENTADEGAGVCVQGGTFTMKNNSLISKNTSGGNGGGVCVQGGTFTMTGGTISENKADYGGGIYVADTEGAQGTVACAGQLIIEGGEISGNSSGYGGGIYLTSTAQLTMKGGKISGNHPKGETSSDTFGGGVYISGENSIFTMAGGEISGNSAKYGGGVAIIGTFSMSGGTISGNEVTDNSNGNGSGSGVYVAYSGNSQLAATFEMSGGAVISSDNDVYLAKEASIKVTGNLTSTDTVATITPDEYSATRQVLVAGSGVNFTDKIINRFEVTQENDNEWYVTVKGCLQKIEKDGDGYYLGKVPATGTNDDGTAIYLMESYDNLLYIARELKTGSITSFNIKLTNDIEIPSSKWQFKQLNVDNASTIDGQGHSITINEDVSSFGNDAGGLFYKLNNSTVKNLVLNGSITAKTSITVNTTDNTTEVGYIGALCRSAYRTTIQNVMSTVTVQDNGSGNAGGLVGYFGGNSNMDEDQPGSFIQNCAVYANVTSKNGTVGGLVGESWANTQTWKIENCIYMGAVSSETGVAGALIGNENTGRISYLTDIWYCESNNCAIFGKEGNAGNITQSRVESKSAKEIASEAAATLLGDAWEYVSDSKYPTLKKL